MVDALANLASNASSPYHVESNVLAHSSIFKEVVLVLETETNNSWITPIAAYLKNRVLSRNRKAVAKIKARAARYAIINDTLYRRLFSSPYQRCVPPEEANHIIKKIHGGICGTHINGLSLCHIIMTQYFYWPMMK